MPPCRGGKSLVTTRVRVTAGPAVAQSWRERDPLRRSSGASRRTTARRRAGRGRRGWSTARPRCMAMKAPGSRGQVQGVHVGARLDVPGDQVLHRRGHQRADRQQEQEQRRRSAGRPAESAPARRSSGASDSSQPSSATPAAGAERADQRAGEDVVGGDVAELVGGDRLDLGVGQLVEHRVVDDDPPGRAEAGDVGVERRRPAGGVGHQHVLHRGAVLLGQRQQIGAQRRRPASARSG